jgi:hypothetical protein
LTIKPLPTNGLQVEGQGSVQEPRHSRPHDGPTSHREEYCHQDASKIRACDAIVQQRSRQHFTIKFSKFREVRGAGWEL